MTVYRFFGLLVSILTNPILRILLKNTTRSYLLIIKDGQVLVTKNILSINLKYEWLMPGGGNKKNEDPSSAVIREVNEELNLKISPKNLELLTAEPLRSERNFDFYVFKLKNTENISIKPNKIEVIDTKWIKLDKVSSYHCTDELRKALKMV